MTKYPDMETRLTCQGITIGSSYSANGTNRYESCTAPARWTVLRGEKTIHVCGNHVRQYRAMNEQSARVAEILGKEREPFYRIAPTAK